MIGYLLIILFTVLNLGESIAVKAYAKRHQSGGSFLLSVLLYKEKYTLLQKIGVITCAAAVVILAL